MMIGIGNRKEEGRVCTVLLLVIRKSPTLSENRLTQFLTWITQSLSQDLNPACPDRMLALYHLCHHHFLSKARFCFNRVWAVKQFMSQQLLWPHFSDAKWTNLSASVGRCLEKVLSIAVHNTPACRAARLNRHIGVTWYVPQKVWTIIKL